MIGPGSDKNDESEINWANEQKIIFLNSSTTVTHAQITNPPQFCIAMPLNPPDFRLKFISFAFDKFQQSGKWKCEAKFWFEFREFEVDFEALRAKSFERPHEKEYSFLNCINCSTAPPPSPRPTGMPFASGFRFSWWKIIAYVYNLGKIIILMIETISCWHYYQKMTIGIFLMMKLSWNKNQHVNECY